ncbi:GNAT family N-acetyltransferase [Leeia sp.]|uniref:GNAT family N-acetyltransferase n=1 Tax=Leeia sp. TaxID=2884678 RepID=UPI0035AF15AB
MTPAPLQATLHAMHARLPGPDGQRFAEAFRHGSMSVELYAPQGHDPQQPHLQDELYVVASGHGTFLRDQERIAFQAGDVLFVPAGMLHRFEQFSDDFQTWVIFWGPRGGEAVGQHLDYTLRPAQPHEAPQLETLLRQYGPNPWNYLPDEGVRQHFAELAAGQAEALLACTPEGEVAGFVTWLSRHPDAERRAREPHSAYIGEALVLPAHAGKGLGGALLRAVRDRLLAAGQGPLYIERHEENAASAGMMRQAGFVPLLTFDDPVRRRHGSKRTTECVYPAPDA